MIVEAMKVSAHESEFGGAVLLSMGLPGLWQRRDEQEAQSYRASRHQSYSREEHLELDPVQAGHRRSQAGWGRYPKHLLVVPDVLGWHLCSLQPPS